MSTRAECLQLQRLIDNYESFNTYSNNDDDENEQNSELFNGDYKYLTSKTSLNKPALSLTNTPNNRNNFFNSMNTNNKNWSHT